jgi:cytochrome P450
VDHAFTPASVRALLPALDSVISRRFDIVAAAGEADLIADLARPIALGAIGMVLGLDPQECEHAREFEQLGEAAEQVWAGDTAISRAAEADAELRDHFSHIIDRHRSERRPTLINHLAQRIDRPDGASFEELRDNIIQIFSAGYLTTTNQIGNVLLAMLRHPDVLHSAGTTPTVIPKVIEEGLRYDSAIQATTRRVLQNLEIDGHALSEGDRIMVIIGSANRDPARFAIQTGSTSSGRTHGRSRLVEVFTIAWALIWQERRST